MDVKTAEKPDELGKVFVLRFKVFTLEQGFSEDIEIDEIDTTAMHLFVNNGTRAAGTLRLFKNGSDVVLGRMAVDKEWRGKGVGRALVNRAVSEARKIGGNYLLAHAQVQALGFYENTGFKKHGEVFMEDGVPHQIVRIKL